MENKELISLYDFLGHAAGSDLGKQVAEVATKLKQPIGVRHITNTRYKGVVHLYRGEFLKQFFEAKNLGLDPQAAITYLSNVANTTTPEWVKTTTY